MRIERRRGVGRCRGEMKILDICIHWYSSMTFDDEMWGCGRLCGCHARIDRLGNGIGIRDTGSQAGVMARFVSPYGATVGSDT